MNDPDGVPKQSCFNKYPLNRAGDAADLQYGPVDDEYPGRYFLDPPCRYGDTLVNERMFHFIQPRSGPESEFPHERAALHRVIQAFCMILSSRPEFVDVCPWMCQQDSRLIFH